MLVFGNLLANAGRHGRVLVLGAGLAGLAAAYELMRAGLDPLVLEARMAAGGRVRTLRAPFADGLYADAGAARIPDDHHWALGYIRHFGLEVAPFYPPSLRSVRLLRGKRYVVAPGSHAYPPGLAVSAEERALGPQGMWRRYVTPRLAEVGDTAAPDWPSPSLLAYDGVSDSNWLRGLGFSEDAVAWDALGDDDPSDSEWSLSALDALRTWAFEQHENVRWKVAGGNDLLPAAFARQLGERVVYRAEVLSVAQDQAGVRVTFRHLGALQTTSADHAICTLPLPALQKVAVTPALPELLQRAMRELTYDPVTRVFVQVRQRYWEAQGDQGWALTDDPAEVWHPTWDLPVPRGLLVAYMRSRLGQRMAALDSEGRGAATQALIERVFPGIAPQAEHLTTVRWGEDRWAGGAYVVLKPGQIGRFYPHILRPQGRLHFAGEHASSLPNWMQGALESGVRAAREVADALA